MERGTEQQAPAELPIEVQCSLVEKVPLHLSGKSRANFLKFGSISPPPTNTTVSQYKSDRMLSDQWCVDGLLELRTAQQHNVDGVIY